jgi:hypothetical protein
MLKACGVIFCVFVFWILFWGTIGRLFTSKARLAEHGRIIGIGISVLFIGGDLLPPMAYASAAWKFFFFLDQLMGLILFTWIFYQHACLCRRSTSGRKRVLVSASLFSIGLIAMAWTNNHLERKEFSLSIASISEIYPPMFRISKPETLDDFFADVDSLKEEVDELAQKKSD